jgi:anti-sigma regulatory factor (Ser/Thr protein kinase)
MDALPPNVRLNLIGSPENVVLVREMLSGVAEAMAIGANDLNDIRTAVTEACNNVVLHAYRGEQGPLEAEVRVMPGALAVLVRDHGGGLESANDSEGATSMGIGLHVIQTLSPEVEFAESASGGTEVRMRFAVPGLRAPAPSLQSAEELPMLALTGSPTATTVSIAPIELARTVLPRMVSALAARAHFSTDRISDVQLLADALVAHARAAMSGDRLNVGVCVEPRELELRVAPLRAGRGRKLVGDSKLEGLGRVIEQLADRHDVDTADGAFETLTLSLVDRRPSPN